MSKSPFFISIKQIIDNQRKRYLFLFPLQLILFLSIVYRTFPIIEDFGMFLLTITGLSIGLLFLGKWMFMLFLFLPLNELLLKWIISTAEDDNEWYEDGELENIDFRQSLENNKGIINYLLHQYSLLIYYFSASFILIFT